MSKTEEFKNLDRTIRDAEIRIRTLKTSLNALDGELANLDALKKTLEDNVRCLKKSKVIALAAEYKKSKEELKRIKERITILGKDKVHFGGSLRDVEVLLQKSITALEKMKKQGDSNVLQFKPSKKDG